MYIFDYLIILSFYLLDSSLFLYPKASLFLGKMKTTLTLLHILSFLIVTNSISSTATEPPTTVPASFLWCVNSFAHNMPQKLSDYEGICDKRDEFLKCLVDKCEYGNYLSARDHFLGTCATLVPKLANDKRYKFFRQFSKNRGDFWNEETRGRKEAIKGYFKFRDSVRYYSNNTNTNRNSGNKHINRNLSIPVNENGEAHTFGDSLLERRRYGDRPKINVDENREKFDNCDQENSQDHFDLIDTLTEEDISKQNTMVPPFRVEEISERTTTVESQASGDAIISLNFEQGEENEANHPEESNNLDETSRRNEEQDFDSLFGSKPKTAPRKKVRHKKKGSIFKLRNRKKKLYKSQMEREYKRKNDENRTKGPFSQAKRILFS